MNWEYKTVVLPISGTLLPKVDPTEIDAALTRLGRDGWELVSAFDTNVNTGSSFQLVAIFKKPCEAKRAPGAN